MSRHPKKRCAVCGQDIVPDPLVDPGNPSHRHQACTTTHPTRAHHRMVTLAKSSPSRSTPRPSQNENATVMLGETEEAVAPPKLVARIAATASHPQGHDAQDARRRANAAAAFAGGLACVAHLAPRCRGARASGRRRRHIRRRRSITAGVDVGEYRAPSSISPRRFPPPWIIEEHNDACFIVRDATGQALGYF